MPMYKGTLKLINKSALLCGFVRLFSNIESDKLHREQMELCFRTPIGIASGFDMNAEYYNAVAAMGCSFEIIGPLACSEKNGVKAAVRKLTKYPPRKIKVGIELGKLQDSKNEDEIAHDLLDAFAYSYDFVDFSVLNFSDKSIGSVNEHAFIEAVTDPILEMRLSYATNKPIILHLSKSLSRQELNSILDYCLMNGIDGLIIDGAELIQAVNEFTKGRLPIIAIVQSKDAAQAKSLLDTGASLIGLERKTKNFRPSFTKSILKLLI